MRGLWNAHAELVIGAVAGVVLGALGLVALRSNAIHLKYRHTRLLKEQPVLMARRQMLSVELQRLRDPLRLATMARQQGFAPPRRILRVSPETTHPRPAQP